MVSKSKVIEGLMVVLGIICLSQSIGGITSIFSGYAPMMIFGAVWSVLLISAGTFLLHQAHKRRKKRKTAEREATELRTPIGLNIVTVQKSRDLRPLGVSLIAYSSLTVGAFAILIYGLSYAFSVLQSIPQPVPEGFVSNPATSIVLGIASILVGYGLLRRKRWGWKWGIVGLFVSIGFSVVDIIENPSIENVGVSAAEDGLVLLMLFYLYRPHVKAYFGITSNNPLVRQE